jgi:hypothetical protein
MLTLTAGQVETLSRSVSYRCDLQILHSSRRRFADHIANDSDSDLLSAIQQTRRVVASYGFTSQRQVGFCFDLRIMYGQAVFTTFWFSSVASEANLASDEKIELLRLYLSAPVGSA